MDLVIIAVWRSMEAILNFLLIEMGLIHIGLLFMMQLVLFITDKSLSVDKEVMEHGNTIGD